MGNPLLIAAQVRPAIWRWPELGERTSDGATICRFVEGGSINDVELYGSIFGGLAVVKPQHLSLLLHRLRRDPARQRRSDERRVSEEHPSWRWRRSYED